MRTGFNDTLLFVTTLVSLVAYGCAPEEPSSGSGSDTSGARTGVTTSLPADTAPAGFARLDDRSIDSTNLVGTPLPAPGAWKRSELVAGVAIFMNAIANDDRPSFFASLSHRTKLLMSSDSSITEQRVWDAARTTLGRIENRRITVVGGSADSVALRIDGTRTVDDVQTSEPVLVDLLREGTTWKVSYPGLHYPEGHLRR